MVPRRLYGFGGQPGRFTTGLFLASASTPAGPGGLGPLDGMPPHEPQEPMAMRAAACAATSASKSVPLRPAILRYVPASPVGIDPSTTSTYFPSFSVIASFNAASASVPEAAITVSW